MGKQIEMLEYHAHLLTMLVDIHILIRNIGSFKVYMSSGRRFQQIQGTQEGGFARA